jgi:hypothetical protein
MNAGCVALALLLGHPAFAADKELDPASISGMRNLAVVSLLPEALEVSHVGITAFQNFHYFGEVDWWRINEHVAGVVSENLKRRDRFEVRSIPYDRRALLNQAREASFGTSAIEALAPALSKLASAHGLDGLVVILPAGKTGRLCRSAAGCIGYGNTGVGIYSVGTSLGHQGANIGNHGYLSMQMNFVAAKDARPLASTDAAAIISMSFDAKGSNEFSGIPAPTLAEYEEMFKNLMSKELSSAVVRLGVLNSAATTQPPADPSVFPALTVNADCCTHLRSLATDIADGYAKAASREGIKLGEAAAVLTVKTVVNNKRGNVFTGPRGGENRVEAVLAYRGNEYFIVESARVMGKLNDVAATVGQMSFEKLRSVLAPAASRDKAGAIPAGGQQ